MQGLPQGVIQDRDALGRMKRGFNPRISKRIKVAAKVEELRHEYDPDGTLLAVDRSRLMLAAKHYVTAETCRDPVVSQRATRVAEYLLSKLKRPEQPAHVPLRDQLAEEHNG